MSAFFRRIHKIQKMGLRPLNSPHSEASERGFFFSLCCWEHCSKKEKKEKKTFKCIEYDLPEHLTNLAAEKIRTFNLSDLCFCMCVCVCVCSYIFVLFVFMSVWFDGLFVELSCPWYRRCKDGEVISCNSSCTELWSFLERNYNEPNLSLY